MDTLTVTIYHIPNIKVGCTNNISSRTAANRNTYGDSIDVIELETFTGSLSECADRESWWSVKLGFGAIRPDQRYDSDANKYMLGLSGPKYNHTKLHGHTTETKKLLSDSKQGFRHTDESKAAISRSLTGMMVGELNSMYGKKSSDLQKSVVGERYRGKVLSEDHKSKIRESCANVKLVECPHCHKIGRPGPMKLWHFDNCRAIA